MNTKYYNDDIEEDFGGTDPREVLHEETGLMQFKGCGILEKLKERLGMDPFGYVKAKDQMDESSAYWNWWKVWQGVKKEYCSPKDSKELFVVLTVADLAKRLGKDERLTTANFRKRLKNRLCPPPVYKDGHLLMGRWSQIENWWKEAKRVIDINNDNKAGNANKNYVRHEVATPMKFKVLAHAWENLDRKWEPEDI